MLMPDIGPYSIAAGNTGSYLGLPVVSPDNYEAIANKLDAQNVSAYLPPGSHPDVIASYRAQMTSYATALRTKNMTVYHIIFHATAAQGGIAYYHPLSRGTVNINVTDPVNSEPLVDYRTLRNPIDIEILIEFMKFTRKYYLESKTLAPLQPVETGPGSNVTSDADLEAFIRNNLTPTVFHPVGTCAMLPRELGGVVDENLLVHNVKKLRIIDASIIPTIIGVNTCQTVYAIAERVSEIKL
jgi:choline dehydrogenase